MLSVKDLDGDSELINNTEDGYKLLTIAALTGTTLLLCSSFPAGKIVIAFVQSCWGKITSIISAALPPGIVWTIYGITIGTSIVSAPEVSLPSPPRKLKWWEKLLPWNW
jgi:hypothetical protein